MSEIKYWLMKSEPDTYPLEQLKKEKKSLWDGVRNYQARNFMKEMNVGDQILFYHSNAKPPGVVGLAQVSKKAVPDPTQFKKNSKYFDPKSTQEKPRWECVEVKYKKTFKNMLSLNEVKEMKSLADMPLVNRSRLSVQPVSKKQFDIIVKHCES